MIAKVIFSRIENEPGHEFHYYVSRFLDRTSANTIIKSFFDVLWDSDSDRITSLRVTIDRESAFSYIDSISHSMTSDMKHMKQQLSLLCSEVNALRKMLGV